ncbi:unnamed protein product [Dibothriocephalus latus]|uniref:Uncharacterized protein n=1 Tax=Dibothriocephalus latus TaxID=60516 RepID=A0A3P7KV60_DIBLA|nr:unnamed protein product [Dibothriocephalus latus]
MTEIYKRAAAFIVPQSPTSQATSDCKNHRLNVLPASSMITPTFLFTLLLLGYCQAITIKAQPKQPPKKPFVISIDPGFEVTGAKLGETELNECADPVQKPNSVTPCYKQTIESTVKFIIAEESLWQKAEFMVGTVAKATATMEQLAQGQVDAVVPPPAGAKTVQKGKLEKNDLSLKFVPTGMRLTPKENTQGQQQQQPPQTGVEHTEEGSGKGAQAQAGATDPVPVTKKCSEQLSVSDNCFEVVTGKN